MAKPRIQSGSLIGVGGALLLIAVATGGDFLRFIDIPAMLIVFGGTFLCVLAKSTIPEFKSAFDTAREAVSHSPTRLSDLIDEMIEVGRVARYNDRWMVVLEDRDPELLFVWKPQKPSPQRVPSRPPACRKSRQARRPTTTLRRHYLR